MSAAREIVPPLGPALKADGSLLCWGRNDSQQTTPSPGTYSAVSLGVLHGCGVHTDGTLTLTLSGDAQLLRPEAVVGRRVATDDLMAASRSERESNTCWVVARSR